VPAVMSHCLLQRPQLWKHVPVFSVMLSEPYYKQKEGHEFVHSAFVSLMLGTVLFIVWGFSLVVKTMLVKLFSLNTRGGEPMVLERRNTVRYLYNLLQLLVRGQAEGYSLVVSKRHFQAIL
jgi:short subunit fatty acids transporter